MCDGTQKELIDLSVGENVTCYDRKTIATGGVASPSCCAAAYWYHLEWKDAPYYKLTYVTADNIQGQVSGSDNHLLLLADVGYPTAAADPTQFSYDHVYTSSFDTAQVGDILVVRPAGSVNLATATITSIDYVVDYGVFGFVPFSGDAIVINNVIVPPNPYMPGAEVSLFAKSPMARKYHDYIRIVSAKNWVNWKGAKDPYFGWSGRTGPEIFPGSNSTRSKAPIVGFTNVTKLPQTGTATLEEAQTYFLNGMGNIIFKPAVPVAANYTTLYLQALQLNT